ncbi:MAG: TetR/AcrR family transcriptional regulator [Actinomycetaceae bacterium]|nr:TetR/AcrR family transcriptional regulator [Actinomycetaceae bacterium]
MTRRGRRPGSPDTRGAIVTAAHRLFMERGYLETSMRAVAREAGVDPALIHHYFGSKTQLFFDAMGFDMDTDAMAAFILAGGPSQIGRRLVTFLISVYEGDIGQQILSTLVSGVEVARLYMVAVSRRLEEVAEQILPGHSTIRREYVAQIESIMAGLVLLRYVARLEHAASLSPRRVIVLYGGLVQQVIDTGIARAKGYHPGSAASR